MRRAVVGAGILFLCLLASVAAGAAPFPAPGGAVNDYVGVLTGAETAQLEAISLELEAKTGAALVVAIVNTHEPESLENYVTRLFEYWGIGRRGEDNGVLILLAMDDRALAIEVGYGLEGALTDARSGQIRDLMLPLFTEGRFAEGLRIGMQAVAAVVGDEYGVSLEGAGGFAVSDLDRRPTLEWPGVAALCLLGVLLAGVLVWLCRPRCPRCKRFLLVTDRVVKAATMAAGGLAVKVYTCPRCGYSRERQYRTSPLYRHGGCAGPWSGGGGWGRSSGGGRSFGGFGGGRSGGGGARGKW
ncbi:MAG: TPM domain-containing protein [bacterium]|nr:TPM domain-containing protein [bacterium]